jgi:hypothetical protein
MPPPHPRYDAWNRLTGVDLNGASDFSDAYEVKYASDARGIRIVKYFDTGSAQPDQNSSFNETLQVMEVRSNHNPDPLEQFVWHLRCKNASRVPWHDATPDGDVTDATDRTLYLL